MPKVLKPTTPSRRQMSIATFAEITKGKPEKNLIVMLKKHSGRNNQGIITVRHQGAGHQKQYRIVDIKGTDKLNIPAIVKAIEYDPYRTAYLALLNYKDGEKRYIIAPEGLKVGDRVVTGLKTKMKPGNRMQLKNIAPGFSIYNIELSPGKGGQIGRSAGSVTRLVTVEGQYAQVQLPSGEIRMVNKECFASIGSPGNADHANIKIGKAGRNRWLGKRPTVRGKAQNAVDHPHGGGKAQQPIGLPGPETPWGKPTLGYKTRKKKKLSTKYIIKTRKGKTLKNLT